MFHCRSCDEPAVGFRTTISHFVCAFHDCADCSLFVSIARRTNRRVEDIIFVGLTEKNRRSPAHRTKSAVRKYVAAVNESPIPVQAAMYAARHIGHFGISARIAPGTIQSTRSTMRRTNDVLVFILSGGCSFVCAASATRLMITAGRFNFAAFPIHVSRTRPIGKTVIGTVLVTSLRSCIENSVNP